MAEHDVEAVWHDFWLPILEVPLERGLGPSRPISVPYSVWEQIKRELYDYHSLVTKLPVFFDDITGGKATNPNTDLKVISELIDERVMQAYDDGYADALQDAGLTKDDLS